MTTKTWFEPHELDVQALDQALIRFRQENVFSSYITDDYYSEHNAYLTHLQELLYKHGIKLTFQIDFSDANCYIAHSGDDTGDLNSLKDGLRQFVSVEINSPSPKPPTLSFAELMDIVEQANHKHQDWLLKHSDYINFLGNFRFLPSSEVEKLDTLALLKSYVLYILLSYMEMECRYFSKERLLYWNNEMDFDEQLLFTADGKRMECRGSFNDDF